jgi:hypothetical protein
MSLPDEVRTLAGDALLVWGEFDDDALRVRSASELAVALDALAGASQAEPCVVRLWSRADDQAIAVLAGRDCALYVVQSEAGYGSSSGDPARADAFELVDHDVGAISIPGAHCVAWSIARAALLRFAEHGQLGEAIVLDGSIPSQLLMLGDCDRAAELESRRAPPADPALTSLPGKAPHGAWAQRLMTGLLELHLIEIDMSILDAITARLAILLVQLGDDAQDSPEVAKQLARELSRVRGVGALFATGGDLQIALRRTQDAPTQPVEMPFV